MRQILRYILVAFSLALLVNACGPSASQKEEARVRRSKIPNPITWDTLTIKNAEPLDAKGIKASCSIELHYITPKEYVSEEILNKIKQELNTFVLGDDFEPSGLSVEEAMTNYAKEYVENYKKTATSQVALWRQVNGNGGYAYFSYDKKMETKILYNEANLISYQMAVTELRGDSTSTVRVKNLVLDLSTGVSLMQNDIFDENVKDSINALIVRQTIKDNGVGSIEELQDLGYWGAADLEANNNFYVDKDGITFTYSPEEYSEERLGVWNIFINYDDLMQYVRKNSPISILVHDWDEPNPSTQNQ